MPVFMEWKFHMSSVDGSIASRWPLWWHSAAVTLYLPDNRTVRSGIYDLCSGSVTQPCNFLIWRGSCYCIQRERVSVKCRALIWRWEDWGQAGDILGTPPAMLSPLHESQVLAHNGGRRCEADTRGWGHLLSPVWRLPALLWLILHPACQIRAVETESLRLTLVIRSIRHICFTWDLNYNYKPKTKWWHCTRTCNGDRSIRLCGITGILYT